MSSPSKIKKELDHVFGNGHSRAEQKIELKRIIPDWVDSGIETITGDHATISPEQNEATGWEVQARITLTENKVSCVFNRMGEVVSDEGVFLKKEEFIENKSMDPEALVKREISQNIEEQSKDGLKRAIMKWIELGNEDGVVALELGSIHRTTDLIGGGGIVISIRDAKRKQIAEFDLAGVLLGEIRFDKESAKDIEPEKKRPKEIKTSRDKKGGNEEAKPCEQEENFPKYGYLEKSKFIFKRRPVNDLIGLLIQKNIQAPGKLGQLIEIYKCLNYTPDYSSLYDEFSFNPEEVTNFDKQIIRLAKGKKSEVVVTSKTRKKRNKPQTQAVEYNGQVFTERQIRSNAVFTAADFKKVSDIDATNIDQLLRQFRDTTKEKAKKVIELYQNLDFIPRMEEVMVYTELARPTVCKVEAVISGVGSGNNAKIKTVLFDSSSDEESGVENELPLEGKIKNLEPVPVFSSRKTDGRSKFHSGYWPQVLEKKIALFSGKTHKLLKIYKQLNDVPDIDEIAEYLNVSVQTIRSWEAEIVNRLEFVEVKLAGANISGEYSASNMNPALSIYLRQAKHDILTRQEEVELAEIMKPRRDWETAKRITDNGPGGGKSSETEIEWAKRYLEKQKKEVLKTTEYNEARKKLISHNLKLVVKIAYDYSSYGVDIMDLVGEGNIGLMKAVERFNPEKGGKLSTYAAWWIKQSIKRALANQGKTIRLPVHMIEKISKMRRIESLLSEELGRDPSNEELAEELGINRAKLAHMKRMALNPKSFDAPVGEDATELGELIGDSRANMSDVELEKKDLLEKLDDLLEVLDKRERQIIDARFGLGGIKPKTLEEVGLDFGITRERVRQLQNIALKKLKRALSEMENTDKNKMMQVLGELV